MIFSGYVNYIDVFQKSIQSRHLDTKLVKATATLARMQLRYAEMQGTGNRILVVDERGTACDPPTPEQVARLRASADVPGFDQLMWITMPATEDSVASYRVFNNDGSEVEQCGNGLRCVARLLASEASDSELFLDSPAGRVDARLLDDGTVAVNMGEPVFSPGNIPFEASGEALRYVIDLDGSEAVEAAVVSMGNPHCVIDVAETAGAPVERLGPLLERHERFPERVNVGFRHVESRGAIDLRVFERGVGETLACGTGAAAAVVAGIREGRLDDTVTVSLPGGKVVVSWRGSGEPVWLTGNADLVSEGSLDI